MFCPQCHFDNPARMKFCGACGAPLTSRCGQCGAENPPQFKFCGECGTPLTRKHQAKGEQTTRRRAKGEAAERGKGKKRQKVVSGQLLVPNLQALVSSPERSGDS